MPQLLAMVPEASRGFIKEVYRASSSNEIHKVNNELLLLDYTRAFTLFSEPTVIGLWITESILSIEKAESLPGDLDMEPVIDVVTPLLKTEVLPFF